MRLAARLRGAPAVVLGGLFVCWAFLLPMWTPLDASLVAPPIAPDGIAGVVLRGSAILLTPQVLYAALIVAAWRAARVGLRRLTAVTLLAIVLAAFTHLSLRHLIGRQRPASLFEQTLTYEGYSFPSGHMTGATVTAILVVVCARTLGQRRRWPVAVAATLVLVTALNRWLINAHWVSDIVGGVLLGACSTALALAIVPQRRPPTPTGRVVGIYHPGRGVGWLLARLAPAVEWLPTTADDHGAGLARAAVASGADRVLVAGGDGTLRQVASGLVNTGITLGVLPVGSGNVLAQAIGVPLDLPSALAVAMTAEPRPLDALKVHRDDCEPELCLTMLGVGADAAVLTDTSERAKRLVGPAAYVAAGARHCRPRTFLVDDSPAAQVIVANVAGLRPSVVFLPDADPTDGRLDVLVARPRTTAEVARMIVAVLRGRPVPFAEIDQAATIEWSFDRAMPLQIDGDVLPAVTTLRVNVVPAALQVAAG